MANRRPRPGDRALLLPPLRNGQAYEGTICLVHEECWGPNREVQTILRLAESVGFDTSKLRVGVDLNKPFWHCTLMDDSFAHVHEDNLEPIDPDADEAERGTTKSNREPETAT